MPAQSYAKGFMNGPSCVNIVGLFSFSFTFVENVSNKSGLGFVEGVSRHLPTGYDLVRPLRSVCVKPGEHADTAGVPVQTVCLSIARV